MHFIDGAKLLAILEHTQYVDDAKLLAIFLDIQKSTAQHAGRELKRKIFKMAKTNQFS